MLLLLLLLLLHRHCRGVRKLEGAVEGVHAALHCCRCLLSVVRAACAVGTESVLTNRSQKRGELAE